jgi:Tfp pilus assembly protein PilO
MIDFRHKENVPASFIALSAILVMAATLLFMLFYPQPTTKGLAEKTRRERMKSLMLTREAKERLALAQATVQANTWPGDAETVAPTAMARLTAMATRRNVKRTGFRPQRTGTSGNLTTLPFLVTVEGPFPQVVEFARDIESAGSRLALNMFQVTTTDDSSDRVTATLVVMAYLRPSRVVEPAPATPGRTPNRA